MEGAGNLGEVADESLVEVHKPYEGLDILDLRWLRPVCDSLDFNRVHHYMVLGDNEPKVVHLSTFKLAFLRSEEQLVGVRIGETGEKRTSGAQDAASATQVERCALHHTRVPYLSDRRLAVLSRRRGEPSQYSY